MMSSIPVFLHSAAECAVLARAAEQGWFFAAMAGSSLVAVSPDPGYLPRRGGADRVTWLQYVDGVWRQWVMPCRR